MTTNYASSDGRRTFNGVSFKTIGPQIARLKAKHPVLLPQHVVDAARPADAPLHNCFTWDDHACGERVRREEAGQLLKVVISYKNKPAEGKPLLVRVHLTQKKTAYVDPALVSDRVDLYLSKIRHAQERMGSLCRELNELRLFATTQGNGRYRPYSTSLDTAVEKQFEAHEAITQIVEQEQVA